MSRVLPSNGEITFANPSRSGGAASAVPAASDSSPATRARARTVRERIDERFLGSTTGNLDAGAGEQNVRPISRRVNPLGNGATVRCIHVTRGRVDEGERARC